MAHAAGELRPGERVQLVDTDGEPLRPEAMTVGRSYIFHYPYETTPCFLIDLGSVAEPAEDLLTADGRSGAGEIDSGFLGDLRAQDELPDAKRELYRLPT